MALPTLLGSFSVESECSADEHTVVSKQESDLSSVIASCLASKSAKAKPQILIMRGQVREVWPEFWGITIQQCREFLDECMASPGWETRCSVTGLVKDYIRPKTQGSGMGYALLRNREAPLEVNVMISHAWNENAEEFISTLERTVAPGEVMFICAFSLYQCEDGEGPSIAQQLGSHVEESPFHRVVAHIRDRGNAAGWRWIYSRLGRLFRVLPVGYLLAAISLYFTPVLRSHCLPAFRTCFVRAARNSTLTWDDAPPNAPSYILVMALSVLFLSCAAVASLARYYCGLYRGRMIAVPNRECDLYSRLWCVYEIFVASQVAVPVCLALTVVPAGRCSSRDAQCSIGQDTQNIRATIEGYALASGHQADYGYVMVDHAIKRLMQRLQFEFIGAIICWGIFYLLVLSAHEALANGRVQCARVLLWCMGMLAFSGSAASMYHMIKSRNGQPSRSTICTMACVFVTAALLSSTIGFIGALLVVVTRRNDTVVSDDVSAAVLSLEAGLAPLTLLITATFTLGVLVVTAACSPKWLVRRAQRRHTFCAACAAGLSLTIVCMVKYVTAGADGELGDLYPLTVQAVIAGPFELGPFMWIPVLMWWGALRWGLKIGPQLPGEINCFVRCCWWYSCCGCCGCFDLIRL